MFGLNPLLMIGVSAAAVAAAWWFGHEAGLRERDGNLGRNFEQALTIEREVAIRREVNLWTQIGDERRARIEMVSTFQRIDEASADARAAMMANLARERASAQAALDTALRNIQELKNASSEMATNWKAGVIPPDITCGVFNAAGCPAPAYPATGADRNQQLEVRQPTTGEGAPS